MAVINITSNNFANVVLKSEKPAVVLFWAMGSPYNMGWDQLLHDLDAEGRDDLTLAKVSVNYAPHIAMRFHIASYPTVALFRGKEVLGTLGGRPVMGALRELIARAEQGAEAGRPAGDEAERTAEPGGAAEPEGSAGPGAEA